MYGNAIIGKCDLPDYYDLRIRKDHVIHYIYKGKGTLKCGEKTYNLNKGQSFLIYPDRPTGCIPDPEDPWGYVWIVIDSPNLISMFEEINYIKDDCVIDYIPSEKVLFLYDYMVAIGNDSSLNMTRLGLATAILGIYIDAFPKKITSENDALYKSAIQYIEYHFNLNECNVHSMTKELNVSPPTLYRLFKNKSGLSPEKYLLQYRINQAKKMLKDGKSVKITALSCGYSSPMYFSQSFKKATGYLPSEYYSKKE